MDRQVYIGASRTVGAFLEIDYQTSNGVYRHCKVYMGQPVTKERITEAIKTNEKRLEHHLPVMAMMQELDRTWLDIP